MKMFKLLTPLVAVFLSVNLNAQVLFDMTLSETSSNHKIILHEDESSLPDSIIVNGYIANHKKGICGDICAGGTIKLELSEKIEGYPYSYMYIVTGCTTGETNKEIISVSATKYTGEERECYYRDVVEVINSKDIPYYKISLLDTKKTIIK
jgi:hypothetical protein